MRRTPRPPILLRVENLDQQRLFRRHRTRIVPLLLGIIGQIPDFVSCTLRYTGVVARSFRWQVGDDSAKIGFV